MKFLKGCAGCRRRKEWLYRRAQKYPAAAKLIATLPGPDITQQVVKSDKNGKTTRKTQART